MLDLNKPVQTRDGRKARIICSDFKSSDGASSNLLITCVEARAGEELIVYKADGRIVSTGTSPADLVNVPEKVYINIFRYSNGKYGEALYNSKDKADVTANGQFFLKQIEVEV